MTPTDQFFFVVLPYLAFVVFFLMTIYRYRAQSFSYSSLSSQFLENQQHFWGMVPFHYGIIVVLTGHLIGFLIPRELLAWNSVPIRLYILEASGLVFGLLTFVGLIAMIVRRHVEPKIRIVTSAADWIILGLLLLQVFFGLYIAIFNGWGSSWFASTATPYLWSLITLNPSAAAIGAMPWMVKLHIVGAFIIIGFFPFTRLVHILVVPNPYLWRKPQMARWYADWKTKRIV